ncbi:MAG: DNA polymerase III subunit alpha [Saprospiraceae bacterium]|nr:DNA polymerase III subunit alpha [Candidatus Vicinibacter affinis]
MPEFCHLHCHTQFSLLDGATDIKSMMAKAKADKMKAVALTDHGNMFGCYSFVKEARANGLKPILGCEFYMVEDRRKQSFLKSGGEKDERFHQLLLAKNEEGYKNLSKLCSLGYIEGLYGKFPRIDKELIQLHHKGLIATSCCIGAEIPQAIIKGKMEEAERLLQWWLNLLGEDFYIEIQRQHGNDDLDGIGISQEQVNQHLLALAKNTMSKSLRPTMSIIWKRKTPYLMTSSLCVNTNSFVDEESRFKFSSPEYFFKTHDQMSERFADVPFALDHTMEIADKCYTPNLERDILLPAFPIPAEFQDQAGYLRHLVYEGAKKRYGTITAQVKSDWTLSSKSLRKWGFVGYFLIVQDFIQAARKLSVGVGPGRGSAAGSAVAYCLTITDIDPIKYNLLFERFLNPERISMPDIDIDFDDRGRDKVLNYVVEKYGRNQVAQIVTFGTMAAKSSIRDVARVKRLDLSSADRLAKLVPAKPGVYLKNLLDLEQQVSDDFTPDEKVKISELRKIFQSTGLEADVLKTATELEGSVKSVGVHASAVIIAPEDIMNFIPVSTAKDTDLWVTR